MGLDGLDRADDLPAPQENVTAPAPLVRNDTAPAANLTATVTNGTAPLNVTFVLEGMDEDGDALSWVFYAFDDGNATINGTVPAPRNTTSAPAAANTTTNRTIPATAFQHTVNVTYLVGNHTARLVVSDGTNQTEMVVLIAVAAVVEEPEEPTVEAESPAPCTTVAPSGDAGAVMAPPQATLYAQGFYVTVGPGEQHVYIDDNGIPGLQTRESCPDQPDTRIAP